MYLNELKDTNYFSGKVAVVTGGTGVLGGEIAATLANLGADVAVLDINPELSEDLKKKFESARGEVIIGQVDVLDPDALQEAADKVCNDLGLVNILVNAAGGNNQKATVTNDREFFYIAPEAFRATSDLNFLGTILPCQKFGRYMAEKGEGQILNISSMAALRPLTRVVAYSAAKAAISNFTKWLAVYMAQNFSNKIRVNAIAPGFFLTKQNRYLLIDKKTGKYTQRGQAILQHTPMRRLGRPDDLLGAVLWLLSPASKFVTGVVVPVDGGFSAYSGV